MAVGYPVAWDADPYVFGLTVLGLAPLQVAVAVIGAVVRLARVDPVRGPLTGLVDILLIASAAAALAFLRSISWS